MIPLGRWTPARSPTLTRVNERPRAVRASRLKVDPKSGLALVRTPWGGLLRRVLGLPVYGKLSGASSPYTFVESVDGGGSWSAGPVVGTAYEVNGVGDLGGSRQLLRPDRSGNWRFQSIRPGRTPPCPSALACVVFNTVCDFPVTGVSVSMTFTPTDPMGTVVTASGSSLVLCLTHVGAGTVAWTFSADNYLPASGSFAVTQCGTGGGDFVDVYPSTYQVCLFGCNIVTDGTEVTITASGSVSGSCTPTASTIPEGRPFAGTPCLCCTFDLTGPVTVAPTIEVTADRYQRIPDNGLSTNVNTCWATVVMEAADGYFCCDPTGTGTCKPIKNTCTLSTPIGDFPVDFGTVHSAPFITINVTSIPAIETYFGLTSGCGAGNPPSTNPVTFFLTSLACSGDGFHGTIGYAGCVDPTNSDDPRCGDVMAAADFDFNAGFGVVSGVYVFRLEGHCPPGLLGDSASEYCHNRYLSGTYTLTEA